MLLGVLYADGLRGRSGSPLPLKEGSTFPYGPRGISPSTVHRKRELAVSSSLELVASFRVLRPATCPKAKTPYGDSPGTPPMGFRSLIAASASGVHSLRRAPDPTLCSALGVSHALDGLLRHLPCGFISPRSHVQGLPFRGLSLARSRTGFPRPDHALLALGTRTCGVNRASSGTPDYRALSPRGECGDERGFFRVPSAPRPSWASPPPGFHSTHRGNDFALPPSTAFIATSPLRLALDVSTARGTVDLGPGYRPARGF